MHPSQHLLVAAFSAAALLLPLPSIAAPTQQLAFFPSPPSKPSPSPLGVGHFSEWSAATKAYFLEDIAKGNAANWTLVMGNEGGDLDSMASAFTWAYHLGHVDPSKPAIGLLQTPEDALDLRPENKLALENVKMSPGHSDLLTIDELPIPAEQLAPMLRGIVLVDHPQPVADWENATVLSIFDHHVDRGFDPDASPRVFLPTASCSTLVGRQMLDEVEALPEGEYHLPHELLELLLSAIAIDSNGLQSKTATPTDKFVASRLFKRSAWREESMYDKLEDIADVLKDAKKDLDHLNVRDLLRRDWKGGIIETPKDKPDIHLGFASIPYSLSYQVDITPNRTLQNWFAIERNWTSEIRADATVALNSFKRYTTADGEVVEEMWLDDEEDDDDEEDEDEDDLDLESPWHANRRRRRGRKIKERQIILVVRPDHRLSVPLANSLFEHISAAIEASDVLNAKPWHAGDDEDEGGKKKSRHRGGGGDGDVGLGPRQMVWTHSVANGGRKLIRPIVDDAVSKWGL